MTRKLYKTLTDYRRVTTEAEEAQAIKDGYGDISKILGKGTPPSPGEAGAAPVGPVGFPSKRYKSLTDYVRVNNEIEAEAAEKLGYKDIAVILGKAKDVKPEPDPQELKEKEVKAKAEEMAKKPVEEIPEPTTMEEPEAPETAIEAPLKPEPVEPEHEPEPEKEAPKPPKKPRKKRKKTVKKKAK